MKKHIKFYRDTNRNRVLIFFLSIGLMLILSGQICPAQITRTDLPQVKPTPPVQKKIVVFKGTGVIKKRPENARFDRQKVSRSLTAAEKSAALKEVMTANSVVFTNENSTIQTYVTLSAQTQYVAGKGYLIYWGTITVNPTSPRISFVEGGYDGIEIFIKPDRAGRWYMLDCKVTASGNVPFRLTGPDGNTTEFSNFAGGHLQTFMVSQNTEWQQFYIQRNDSWGLDSCEVTTTD